MQVFDVDGLRLVLRQVRKAVVRRVRLEERVVCRAHPGPCVPGPQLFFLEPRAR